MKELPPSLQCQFLFSFCPVTSEEQSFSLKPFIYEFQVENFFVSTFFNLYIVHIRMNEKLRFLLTIPLVINH